MPCKTESSRSFSLWGEEIHTQPVAWPYLFHSFQKPVLLGKVTLFILPFSNSQLVTLPACSLSREWVMKSLQLHGLWLARLLCPWDFSGRILEWVAISSSRGSSQPRDQTHISCISCVQVDSLLLSHGGRPTGNPEWVQCPCPRNSIYHLFQRSAILGFSINQCY